jgi:D-alanyl-D-alanine carboxypeptidase
MFRSLTYSPSHRLRRVAVKALLVLSIAGWNAATASSPGGQNNKALEAALRKDLQGYLDDRSAIEHISTLSLTVSFRCDHDDINVAVGTTKYRAGNPVTPSNVFQIGSNTKVFTSVLLLKFEAEGILSIDDKVGKWLPEYPDWKDVKIRQLLDMTSDIPNYSDNPAWERDYSDDPYIQSTPEQLVAYVYPPKKMETPGAKFKYSNTGYILAQMIIDKASPWHSYQAELDRLIEDTDLRDTFYEPYFYPSAVTRRLVAGYYVNTDDTGLKKLLGTDTSDYSLGWTQAAGGMISTPRDLTKWTRALFEGDVLPAEQRRELMSLVSVQTGQPIEHTSDSDPAGFGLGVFQVTNSTGVFWGYQGSTIGYRATYAYYPKNGLILCFFTNSQTTKENNVINDDLVPNLLATLKAFGVD